jgi:hypothetical protein
MPVFGCRNPRRVSFVAAHEPAHQLARRPCCIHLQEEMAHHSHPVAAKNETLNIIEFQPGRLRRLAMAFLKQAVQQAPAFSAPLLFTLSARNRAGPATGNQRLDVLITEAGIALIKADRSPAHRHGKVDEFLQVFRARRRRRALRQLQKSTSKASPIFRVKSAMYLLKSPS